MVYTLFLFHVYETHKMMFYSQWFPYFIEKYEYLHIMYINGWSVHTHCHCFWQNARKLFEIFSVGVPLTISIYSTVSRKKTWETAKVYTV